MAAIPRSFVISLLLILLCRSNYSANATSSLLSFDSIYQFGDSISDTGNLMRETAVSNCNYKPYGETAFPKPTGRCSDGLLVIDYLAKAFNLPFLNPYLERGANFTNGVNFAVAGATALHPSRYGVVPTKSGLTVQLGWFRYHLNSTCSTPSHYKSKLKRALFMVGEVGGNDYNYALFGRNTTLKDVRKLVPEVVQTIANAVKEVISHGALHVVVPGNFPVGCMPIYLRRFKSNDTTMYDSIGCLTSMNEFAMLHNEQLQQAIKELNEQNPGVNIYYGDFYSGSRWILHNAVSLGFDKDELFEPCCGSKTRQCGLGNDVPLCSDPKKRVSWDGIHPTQEAYRHLSEWLLSNTFTQATSSPVQEPAPTPSPVQEPASAPKKGSAHPIAVDILQVVMASSLALWAIGSNLF